MAWYFHRATTMALPANALVIPIASVLLPSAVLAVALSYLVALAGIRAGVDCGILARSADWNRSPHWPSAHLRRARAHANTLVVSVAAAFSVGLALLLARRRIFAAVGVAGLLASALWIVLLAAQAAVASRRFRDHGHRCRAGRFAAADHPGGQDAAAGCRRHSWQFALRFRCWRRSRLAVSLVARHSRLDADRHLARPQRSHGRHAQHHRELPAARILVWSRIARRRILKSEQRPRRRSMWNRSHTPPATVSTLAASACGC